MEQAQGLSGEAYVKFKKALLSRRIVPGSTLSQSQLAEILAVSVSPLRNALKVLESEGFVRVLPRSGIRIRKPDLDLIKNSYQFRRIIEDAALPRFLETCSSDELRQIREAHERIISTAKGRIDDRVALFDEMGEIDFAFHLRMVGALENPIIAAAYKTNHERILLIRLDRHQATIPHVMTTFKEHLRIIDALLEGDIEEARRALSDHLNQAMHRAMGL